MPTLITLALSLLGVADLPPIDAGQFAAIVKERSAPLKSLAFVYEGRMEWVGPGNLVERPGTFDQEYQGAFLYRSDGAALFDLYMRRATPTAEVRRRKMSVLHGRLEDATRSTAGSPFSDPARDVRVGPRTIESFSKTDSPRDLLMTTWDLSFTGDQLRSVNFLAEGWEEVDGRNCLKVRLDLSLNDDRRERDFRRYWVDLERNAQVLRMEYYQDKKTITRVDITAIVARKLPDGSAFWLPVRSVRRSFDDGDRIFGEPLYERSMAIVEGSLQLNPDLPDALFSVARASALPLPGELERIEKGAKSGKLRLQFESQPTPKPEPLKTDPVSVRGRIDKHLAEANRQSKELEASSPARRSWDGAMALQLGFAAAGVALLGGVAARKWRNR